MNNEARYNYAILHLLECCDNRQLHCHDSSAGCVCVCVCVCVCEGVTHGQCTGKTGHPLVTPLLLKQFITIHGIFIQVSNIKTHRNDIDQTEVGKPLCLISVCGKTQPDGNEMTQSNSCQQILPFLLLLFLFVCLFVCFFNFL